MTDPKKVLLRKPVVKAWCLPDLSEERLKELHQIIVGVFAALYPIVSVLSQDDLIVLFPPDSMEYGKGSEVLVEVTQLELPKLKRGAKRLRNDLARQLVIAVSSFLKTDHAIQVHCHVSRVDVHDGYYSTDNLAEQTHA
jgi:hypothetical protein